MHVIRILLAGPQLFADLIERLIGTEPDVAIVGKVPADTSLGSLARDRDADAILLGMTNDAATSRINVTLCEVPTVKLIALAADWRSATLHELRPMSAPIVDLSRDGLLDAIRAAVASAANRVTP